MAGTMLAQDSGFSLGVDLAVPMGDAGKVYSFGIGPMASFERGFGDSGLGGFSLAYTIMSPKDEFIKSAAIIPIQAHFKYFFDDVREGAYIGAMVGMAVQTIKTKDISGGGITVVGESSAKTGLSLAPMVGYVLNERLDLGLRYQLIFTSNSNDGSINSQSETKSTSYIALRAAYNF